MAVVAVSGVVIAKSRTAPASWVGVFSLMIMRSGLSSM